MRLTHPRRVIPTSLVLAGMITLTACGGFSEDEEAPADGGGGESSAAAEGSEGPELSEPPAIEGDVVSDGEAYEIRFGIGLAEDSAQALSVDYFGEILKQRSDGRIEVNLFPNSQVGDDLQMMNALQSGTLEMTYPSTSPATSFVPELALFDLPFLFPTPEDADALL
ncbi:MAG: TRAP transporter substrate-binding protein DctP, partial [Ornithinimicrobium sp.]|uniref:TRAP transporter substrate-binding protein DctP n=1 Tax=Ornithinimicrobium sp. TaxID=1977084 RepID=UPI003D9B357E